MKASTLTLLWQQGCNPRTTLALANAQTLVKGQQLPLQHQAHKAARRPAKNDRSTETSFPLVRFQRLQNLTTGFHSTNEHHSNHRYEPECHYFCYAQKNSLIPVISDGSASDQSTHCPTTIAKSLTRPPLDQLLHTVIEERASV